MNSTDPFASCSQLDKTLAAGIELKPGDRVRLRPRGGADAMDIMLRGKTATIAAIEQDFENRIHLAVTIDDDPGRDMGIDGRPGHRFYFGVDEIEMLDQPPERAMSETPRILVACVGNIFHGDDAFGVEVARLLLQRPMPPGVRVVDFGIRGLDLTYALLDGCDIAIIVDASPRGGPPGTLYVIEPQADTTPDPAPAPEDLTLEAHGMNPDKVLRVVRSMGGGVRRVLVVGCEPAQLDPDEMSMEISPAVRAALEPAVVLIESLLQKMLSHEAQAVGQA